MGFRSGLRNLVFGPDTFATSTRLGEVKATVAPSQATSIPLEFERKTNPDYAQFTQMRIIGNDQPVYSRANYHAFSQEGYIRNITAHRCIDMRATAMAGIPWHLYKNGDKKKEVKSHPILDLLKRPNPDESQGMFIRKVAAFHVLSGNAYMWANRLKNAPEPKELWTLRPDRVSIVPGMNGIARYEYRINNTQKIKYDPQDICHWKTFHPLDDLYGLSSTQVAATMITQQNAGDDRNTALLQNAARPSGVLLAKGSLSDPDFERLNNEIVEKYSGINNNGMPMLFDNDMTWQSLGLSPLELDWSSSSANASRQICMALGTPSILLGDTEAKTYANYETAEVVYYTDTLLPDMDILRDCLNMWLPPMYGDEVFLDYDKTDIEALQENRDGASQRASTEWNNGGITFNEYRRAIGQGELDGGDFLKFVAGKQVFLVSQDRLKEYVEAETERSINPPQPMPTVIHQLPSDTEDDNKKPALPSGPVVDSTASDANSAKKSAGNTEAIKAITAISMEAMRLLHQKNAQDEQGDVSLHERVKVPSAKITPIRNDVSDFFDRFEQEEAVAQ